MNRDYENHRKEKHKPQEKQELMTFVSDKFANHKQRGANPFFRVI